MRFLLDQDVYATTARLLLDLGHEVIPAAQIGLARADDEDVLRAAQDQGRLFVTRDRDFGGLVFVNFTIPIVQTAQLLRGLVQPRFIPPSPLRRSLRNLIAPRLWG